MDNPEAKIHPCTCSFRKTLSFPSTHTGHVTFCATIVYEYCHIFSGSTEVLSLMVVEGEELPRDDNGEEWTKPKRTRRRGVRTMFVPGSKNIVVFKLT